MHQKMHLFHSLQVSVIASEANIATNRFPMNYAPIVSIYTTDVHVHVDDATLLLLNPFKRRTLNY